MIDGKLSIEADNYFSNSVIPMEFILQNEAKALIRKVTDTCQAY